MATRPVRNTVIVLLTVLYGCAYDPPTADPVVVERPVSQTESLIGLCSAGLEKGMGATVEAAWLRLGGRVSVGFQEYVRGVIFSRDGLSSHDKRAMYENYIDCVLQLQQGVSDSGDTKAGRCELRLQSCQRSAASQLASCLERARFKCVDECVRKFGYSHKQCVKRMCKPNDPSNRAGWTQRLCRSEDRAGLVCESQYQTCLN